MRLLHFRSLLQRALRTLAWLSAAALLPVPHLPLHAQTAGIDCTAPAGQTEVLICHAPRLAQLNAHIAAAYRHDQTLLSPASMTLVQTDQAAYLKTLHAKANTCARDGKTNHWDPSDVIYCISRPMESRLAQLAAWQLGNGTTLFQTSGPDGYPFG